MQIQVYTDNFIQGDARVTETAEEEVKSELQYLADRLTRVEVHLKDQNAEKHGPDHIRCTMEARPRGLDPIAVHHDAENIRSAIKGAAKKLRARLTSEFEKLDNPHR